MPTSLNGVNFFNPTEEEEEQHQHAGDSQSIQSASKPTDPLESLKNCSLTPELAASPGVSEKILELVCKLTDVITMRKPEPSKKSSLKKEKKSSKVSFRPQQNSVIKKNTEVQPTNGSKLWDESCSFCDEICEDNTNTVRSSMKPEEPESPKIRPSPESRVERRSSVNTAKAQLLSKAKSFNEAANVCHPDQSPLFISTAKNYSIEACSDESAYALYSDVTSAFLPVPQQQKPGTLAETRLLDEDDTQSERSPTRTQSGTVVRTPPKEQPTEHPPKTKPRKIRKSNKNVALWERVISPAYTPIRRDCGPLVKQSPPSIRARVEKNRRDAALNKQQRLETVDSEVFDNGPFRPAYALGSYADHGTSPYEISNTPIEVNESRKQRTIEIQNRILSTEKVRNKILQQILTTHIFEKAMHSISLSNAATDRAKII